MLLECAKNGERSCSNVISAGLGGTMPASELAAEMYSQRAASRLVSPAAHHRSNANCVSARVRFITAGWPGSH